MKSSGVCPKCSSREIYTDADSKSYNESRSMQIGFWHTAGMDRYVCTKCGYIELYLRDKDKNNTNVMDRLRANWRRR